MIKNLNSLGFDTGKYVEKLDSCVSEFKSNLEDGDYIEYRAFLILKEKRYEKIIRDLNELKISLEKMNIFYRGVNFSSIVNSGINSVNKQNNNVYDLVGDMINILEGIKSYDEYFDGEKEIKEKIFKGVYSLIKLELSTNYYSKLFDYIEKDNEYLYFINECIRNEINELDLTSSEYSKLNEKIACLNNNGLNNNYFDLEVIKLLLNVDNKFMLGNKVTDKLNSIVGDLYHASGRVNNGLSYEIKGLIEDKSKLVKLRKEFIKRFTALALTLTITTGGGIGIYKGVKKACIKDYCDKIVTTYSPRNGLASSKEEILLSSKDEYDNKIYLKEYGLWGKEVDANGNVKREIKTYDVSDVKLDNIEDYINYAIDNSNMYYTLSYEYGDLDKVSRYDSEYVEVTKSDVDTSNVRSYANEDDLSVFCCLAYIGYIAFLAVATFIPYFKDLERSNWYSVSRMSISDYCFRSFKYLKNYLETKKTCILKFDSLKKTINGNLEFIKKNESLKLEFDRLYKENIYLLDNPEELYRKFESVSNDFDEVSNMLLDSIKDVKVKKLELISSEEVKEDK